MRHRGLHGELWRLRREPGERLRAGHGGRHRQLRLVRGDLLQRPWHDVVRRGACLPVCATGYGNCNGNAGDGCETDTTTTPAHCNGCGLSCAPAHATPLCGSGVCGYQSCDPGFADCNGGAANGCETSITTVQNCGSCGSACTNQHGSTSCANGICSPQCSSGFASCDGSPANGCETNTNTNSNHCGTCNHKCPTLTAC